MPNAGIYAIDVSCAALDDKDEPAYVNEQATPFVLPDEALDRLRAAAGTIIMASPEFQRLRKDVDARIRPRLRQLQRQQRQLPASCPEASADPTSRSHKKRRPQCPWPNFRGHF
ncbi:hypothetical protein [Accumulibacter sp.]|uniref:hypothetical protein n=1 Tax=Accumulibacter sp. TaxID=2053492 RepID=UPI00262E5708|nr:hypothetical protein [Accumulibacter sp.]